MRLFHIAGQPVDGINVQVRVPSAAKSFFFFPGFNVLRGEAGNDGPGLIVFERNSMKISAIDCATPSSQPKEEANRDQGCSARNLVAVYPVEIRLYRRSM